MQQSTQIVQKIIKLNVKKTLTGLKGGINPCPLISLIRQNTANVSNNFVHIFDTNFYVVLTLIFTQYFFCFSFLILLFFRCVCLFVVSLYLMLTYWLSDLFSLYQFCCGWCFCEFLFIFFPLFTSGSKIIDRSRRRCMKSQVSKRLISIKNSSSSSEYLSCKSW